ncbi:hypothetical protein UZ36_00670 [Candidatus Nitromaritima sp. SCGC AAA799-C22]|nr:hypothetical protein UZ36_00670 [Candidatus Nitromaritima sp. SCGC AAA799-C22]
MSFQFKYFQNRPPITLALVLAVLLFPTDANAFDKPLAAKTTGEDSPHILKSNNFSLNARNVKVLKSHGNILWMGTSMGVIRYDTTTSEDYTIYDNRNGLLSNGIFSIVTGPENRIWVGTYGGGLSRLEGGHWTHLNTPQGLNDAFVYDVEFSGDAMWIATWSGANRVRGDPLSRSAWESFTVENTGGGLIDNWVYAVEIGRDNNIWFGTEGGLSLFDGQQWRNWNHEDGLGASHDIVKEDNRAVTDSFQGTHHNNHQPDLPNTRAQDYRPNYIVAMLLDRANRLWMGTWGAGLSLFDPKTQSFRNFTVQDGLPGNYILAIDQGPDGNLWIGSNNGLSRFDGTRFLNYSRINGLTTDFVFSIEFSDDHFLWVGGHHGMAQFKIDPASGELARLD